MPPRLLALWLLAVAGCFHREPCQRDAQCQQGEVCYPDQLCLPRDVAARAGAPPGSECGHDRACPAPAECRNGSCYLASPVDRPPSFSGVTGVDPDGAGALLVSWPYPDDDHTPTYLIEVLLWRGVTPDPPTDGPPLAVVTEQVFFRDTGLERGVTYYYRAHARDSVGQLDRNTRVLAGTPSDPPLVPPGVDYTTQIQPIFDANCVICHGGAAGLSLENFVNLQAGAVHGAAVVPCDPAGSNLAGKISPAPPFGARMPRSGPPFLTPLDRALIDRWIADGARESYQPGACP